MKKSVCLLLIFVLLPLCTALAADDPLYMATARISGPIYAEMNTASRQTGRISEGASIRVYAIYPDWAYIAYNGGKGYVPRRYLLAGKPVDRINTPPWGVEFCHYVGTAGPGGLAVHTAPDSTSGVIIALGEGARISIIDIADGWARVAYWRQYGYVDTNALAELLPVCTVAALGDSQTPIATFTSYYVVNSEDEVVRGKETNIGVNCAYMNNDILAAGKTMDYDQHYGSYSRSKGYVSGPVLLDTGWGKGPGGGVCQVSSTLYNVLLQLPGVSIVQRRSHGTNGIEYLPIDMDAAVGNPNSGIDMVVRNDYDFDLRFEAQAQDGALFIAVYRVTE